MIISLQLDTEYVLNQPALYFSRIAPYNAGRKGAGGMGNQPVHWEGAAAAVPPAVED